MLSREDNGGIDTFAKFISCILFDALSKDIATSQNILDRISTFFGAASAPQEKRELIIKLLDALTFYRPGAEQIRLTREGPAHVTAIPWFADELVAKSGIQVTRAYQTTSEFYQLSDGNYGHYGYRQLSYDYIHLHLLTLGYQRTTPPPPHQFAPTASP